MDETVFYDMLDAVGEIVDNNEKILEEEDYMPTVDELSEEISDKPGLENCAPLLMYFASDPYKNSDIREQTEYQRLVKFAKDTLYRINLESTTTTQ